MDDTNQDRPPEPKPAESERDSKEQVPDDAPNLASTDLVGELTDTKDRLLRAVAEQENIRRQMQRQRDEAVKFAASSLARDLLDTLDNLRRAIESVPSEVSSQDAVRPLLKGVEVTESNLLATLARHGMQRIDALGQAFDPNIHHALRERPAGTAAEGTVIEVLQPGYLLNGRVLRPAMVGVAVRGG